MSEQQDKLIMVPTDPYSDYQAGDQVKVMTKMSMGMKAVYIG